MKIDELLKEYDLEIDDVRWYLASILAMRLFQYREDEFGLTKYIWAGAMEEELYDMEEQFINELQADYDQGITDEIKIRDILKEIVDAQTKRFAEPLNGED